MRPNCWGRLTLGFVVGGLVAAATATDLTEAELAKLTPKQTKVLETAAEHEEKYLELLGDGKYRDALPFGQKVVAAYEQVIGKEHPLTAQWTAEIGSTHFELGNYDEAKKHFDRALAAQQKKLGAEHEETLLTLQYLGEYHLFYSSDLAAAKKLFDDILRIRLKTLGEKNEDTASVLNDLGLWADAVGDHKAARDFHHRCLAIRRELLGDESEDTASSLGNLGLADFAAADYLAARDHQEEALKIRRKTLGGKHADTALSLINLGLVQATLGDYAAARKSFDEALEIMREVYGEKHANYALTLMNLSSLLLVQDKLDEAEALAERALAIQEEAFGKDHVETTGSLVTVGGIKIKRGELTAAEPFYVRSLEILTKTFGADSLRVGGVLGEFAELQRLQGRLEESQKTIQKVHAIAREQLGDDKFDTAILRCDVGFTAAALGDWPTAAADIDAGRRVMRQAALEILPGLPERELLKCLKESDTETWHGALTLGLLQQADRAWCEKSAAWLVNGKATAQEALAQQTLLARESTDPKLAGVVNELLSVRRRLAALGVLQPGKNDEADHRAELEALEAQERDLTKQVTRGRPVSEVSRWTEIDALRKKLPADGMFVSFVRLKLFNLKPKSYAERFGEEHYLAWLIPAAGAGEVRIVDLGLATEVDELIQKLSVIVASVAGDAWAKRGEVETAKQTKAALQALSQRVLFPLLPHLGERTTLLLSPDSRLWLAPWQALLLKDGRFAIEKYRIRFLLSGRELTAAVTAPPAKSALVFADPNYNLTPDAVETSLKAVFREKYQPPDGAAPRLRSAASEGRTEVARLPGTAVEARAIQPALELFTRTKPVAYTDQYALEGVFKKMNPPRVLVLSTHGFFQEDQTAAGGSQWSSGGASRAESGKPLENPLLRCGLLLAGCNQPRTDGGDDGVLTGLEILGADLRGTELVVLSACETGLGKVNDGDGVAGLRQAFQLAGAKSVVASLWQVPDRDSALLMIDFFNELAAGKAKDEALRAAQIKRIESRRERYGAAHPFFWAAWTVTGE